MATQEEINAWVQKKLDEEKAEAQIAQIRQSAELEKKVHADAIAAIDEQKEAAISAIVSK